MESLMSQEDKEKSFFNLASLSKGMCMLFLQYFRVVDYFVSLLGLGSFQN